MKPAAEFEELKAELERFMAEHIYPNEQQFLEECEAIQRSGNEWTDPPILTRLQRLAKQRGLWNLWLPTDSAKVAGPEYEQLAGGLNNFQYGALCEIMGTANHMEFASQCFNCASPDTGNMETLCRFANQDQKRRWLGPLLRGEIRSCFAMTEPEVASSDASNISISIVRDERAGEYVINGRKWWITGAGSLRCQIMILMGKTDPSAEPFRQQSMILVPVNSEGITLIRPMQIFGDAEPPKGHMEISFQEVRVPFSAVLAKEGQGFEIAQARLGPGRIHHCMRLLGTAERALALMCRRSSERTAFGKKLAEFDTMMQDIARSRAEITQARMLTQHAAALLDLHGTKSAECRQMLSLVKAVVPSMTQAVCDRAIQAHGAMGLSQDTFLATAFSWARWLRFADGPDEVHWRTAARLELKSQHRRPGLYQLGHYKHKERVFRVTADPVSPKALALLNAKL